VPVRRPGNVTVHVFGPDEQALDGCCIASDLNPLNGPPLSASWGGLATSIGFDTFGGQDDRMYATARLIESLRILTAVGTVLLTVAACGESPADRKSLEFFESRIRPVLIEHCYECHSAASETPEAGLRLDTRLGLLTGGDSGPALSPGDAAGSLLLSALRYKGLEMPPDRKLPDEVVRDFETWIRGGAVDPREGDASPVGRDAIDFAAGREFWSLRSVQRHEPPVVRDRDRINGRIDTFIQAQLEEAGLTPSLAADRRTLIRRATFDLIGLPPTPEDVDAFLFDDRPDAYQRVVDRLLADPRYGERQARMWLDIARYAEDQAHIVGDDQSLFYPNAWLYRDWVINAFNADLPYDRFLMLQLAADQLDVDETQLAALGFLGLGPKYYRRNAPEVMAEEWEDRVDVVTRGLLALSVACARCHDHKYDPVSTEDYYALAGIFAGTEMFNRPLGTDCEIEKNGEAKNPAEAMHVVRDAEPRDLPVFVRGNLNAKGEVVPRRFLTVLCEEPTPFKSGSGRRDLAEAIATDENPLTARVIVNRVWGSHFGRPLVETPSDFGRRGSTPTHPELLDDLAARFMENGWSIKHLRREIVLSAAYQRNSENLAFERETADSVDVAPNLADPENRLLWRMDRRRLDIEQWRDAVLAISGELVETVGGPSIEVDNPAARRRSVYGVVSRFQLNPMLSLFDFPDPNAHSARREETVTPLQKLFVLNSDFLMRHAETLARRLAEGPGPDEARIQWAYRLVYGREATGEEIRLAEDFLAVADDQRATRWTQYAQVLLASNELLFLD
jgi:hypothetical protein